MSEEARDENERIIVNDRRLLTEEERKGVATPTEEEPIETTTSSQKSAEEEPESETPPQDVDVTTLYHLFIGELSARAWIHMGLIQNPVTKLVVKDLPQARLAIDGVAALLEKLDPHLTAEERRQYQTLINDLRMNFVKHSG